MQRFKRPPAMGGREERGHAGPGVPEGDTPVERRRFLQAVEAPSPPAHEVQGPVDVHLMGSAASIFGEKIQDRPDGSTWCFVP